MASTEHDAPAEVDEHGHMCVGCTGQQRGIDAHDSVLGVGGQGGIHHASLITGGFELGFHN